MSVEHVVHLIHCPGQLMNGHNSIVSLDTTAKELDMTKQLCYLRMVTRPVVEEIELPICCTSAIILSAS